MIMDFKTQSALVGASYAAILDNFADNFLTIHKLTSIAKGCEKYAPTIVKKIAEFILLVSLFSILIIFSQRTFTNIEFQLKLTVFFLFIFIQVEPDVQLSAFHLIDWLFRHTSFAYFELLNKSIVSIFCGAYKEVSCAFKLIIYHPVRHAFNKFLINFNFLFNYLVGRK